MGEPSGTSVACGRESKASGAGRISDTSEAGGTGEPSGTGVAWGRGGGGYW